MDLPSAATDQWSKCNPTVRLGRRGNRVSSAVCIALICSCSHRADPAAAFESIRATSQRGNFSKARAEAQRSYDAWQSRPSEKWHWKFKLLDAEMLLLNGDTRQARELLRTAPPTQYADLQPRYQMLCGYVAFRAGEDSKGRSLVAGAAVAAHFRADYELEADCDLLLAAYASPDNGAETEHIIDGIVRLADTHRLPFQKSAALLNLGWLRIHQSRFAAAIPPLQEAAQTAKQANAPLLYSMNIGNLSTCYYNLGDFDQATELRKEAISIQEHAGLTTALRDSYVELGSIQLLQGETAAAIDSMRHALSLANERDTPEVFSLIASQLASALETNGNLDEADHLTRQAMRLATNGDTEAQLALRLNEAAIKRDRRDPGGALELYLNIIKQGKAYPWVTWSAEAHAAEIYAAQTDAVNAREARHHFEGALHTIEASRGEQLESRYQVTFLSQLIRLYQDYVAFLIRQRDTAEALLVADSSRASVLTNSITGADARANHALVARVQAAARRSHAAFLFYFLAPRQSHLWVITDREVKCLTLPDEQEIVSPVHSYQRMLEIDKADPLRPPANLPLRLYRMLIGPALPSIGQLHNLILIPDGALHRLNFETLVVDVPTPHYWIEDVTISIAPSLNILTAKPSTNAAASASLLLIGDAQSASAEYPRLPNAALEMDAVRHHFPMTATTMLRGAAAVPSAYLTAQPERFKTLHIAAHGEANERSPLDSAIVLSPEGDGYRLYARDIMKRRLHADLVTLSACRSARARTFSGEGPVGFVWAFFQAGAENVVASLWDVNDRSTANLMDGFYTALDKGEPYAEALRLAKLNAIRENSQPYFWAPFQLYIRRFPQ